MRHRLDDAVIDRERVLDDVLAVARGRRGADLRFRETAVDLLQELADQRDRVAAVRHVLRADDAAVHVRHDRLDRRGAGVDADEDRLAVPDAVADLDARPVVALDERVVFRLIFEKRRAGAVLLLRRVVGDAVDQRLERDRRIVRGERRAERDEIERIFRTDARDAERVVERGAQLGEERHRAAEVDDLARDLAALREARDRLVHDGVQDARGDVLFQRALVQKRLDVALCENATARGDRVDLLVLLRKLVELVRRDVQKRRHLVDERARAAGAGAVHAHLKAGGVVAVGQKEDLRVLAAELDNRVRARHEPVHRDARGVDLLHKRDVAALRKAHARRAGDAQLHLCIRELRLHLAQHFDRFLDNARKVALIFGK